MTKTVSAGKEFWISFLLECDPVAAHLQLRGKTVVHSKETAVPREIGIVADDVLVVGYEKPVAIDGRGRIVEGIGFAVEPASLGLYE